MEQVQNENMADGQSSTQNPRSYLISWGPPETNKRIRIIDTPGVGDTRGLEEEKKNFAKILDYIANFKELHAICILMKPNESKLTLTFRYCINELLTHLHVSASKNILFCFTNARQTLYRPGETLPTLAAHLEKLQEDRGIEIPLNKSTLYCFENESFRCLCAWREGVNFTNNEMNNYNLSWQITVREIFRLFKRIAALPVHNVNETISVNNVRSMALTAEIFLVDANKKKYQLEKEAEMVNKHCVEFTAYLKQNSLMTYNDAYKEYVDNQIKEAKMVVEEGGSADVMKKLEERKKYLKAFYRSKRE